MPLDHSADINDDLEMHLDHLADIDDDLEMHLDCCNVGHMHPDNGRHSPRCFDGYLQRQW